MSLTTITPAPLTTIFTPPVGCFHNARTIDSTCSEGSNHVIACTWTPPVSCYPPKPLIQTSASTTLTTDGLKVVVVTKLLSMRYLYSPGVVPAGFTSAVVSSAGLTTTAICCPSGWTYATGWCSSMAQEDFVTGTRTEFLTITSGSDVGFYTKTTATLATSGNFALVMPEIVVMWQAKDLPRFTPASAPALPFTELEQWKASAAQRSRAGPTATTTQTSRNTSTSVSDLSTGVQAGIGVGVGIAAAALLLIVVGFIILQKKRRRRRESHHKPENGTYSEYLYQGGKPELDAKERSIGELEGQRDPAEVEALDYQLPGPPRSKTRFELPGNGHEIHEMA